jgi:hypothetical protein
METGRFLREGQHPMQSPSITHVHEYVKPTLWQLPPRSARRLQAAPAMRRLAVEAGRVWLTRSQVALEPGEDVWLSAGQSLLLPAGSEWVVEGWPEARVTVQASADGA